MFGFSNKLLICLLNVLLVPSSRSCRCYQEHEQIAFCRGDYALKFRVDERSIVYRVNGQYLETHPGTGYAEEIYRHRISGLQIYQKKDELNGVDMTYIYSRVSGAACGRYLETQKTYATIGGSVLDKRFYIDSCINVINLSKLGFFNQTIALLNMQVLYKRGCPPKCRVSDCRYQTPDCLTTKSSDICEVTALGEGSQPFQSACVPLGINTCAWITNGIFLPPKGKTSIKSSG